MKSSTLSSITALVVAVALALGVTACDSSGGGSANLELRLTDAPGDIVEAVVTIDRVALVPADESSDGDASEGGIETLGGAPFQVDLTKLQDGVDTLLANTSIPAGTYNQIRLVTASDADLKYIDSAGDTVSTTVTVPSGTDTGVKINLMSATFEDGQDIEILLDFSIEQSFVMRDGSYIFKPVVLTKSFAVDGSERATGTRP